MSEEIEKLKNRIVSLEATISFVELKAEKEIQELKEKNRVGDYDIHEIKSLCNEILIRRK